MQRQLDRSRHYAAEFDLDLQDASFEDLGVSAFDRSNVTKGALAAFIQAVESGVIQRGSLLLVENLDRLSRSDCLDAMSLLRHLILLGIRIVTLIDRKILDEESIKDPMSLIWAVMVFVRANEESSVKSDRIRKAHERKREIELVLRSVRGLDGSRRTKPELDGMLFRKKLKVYSRCLK